MSLEVEQESRHQTGDYIGASALGFVLVVGYLLLSFVAIVYLLWLITTIYYFLMLGSIWTGLLISIGFILGNILGVLLLVYGITWILKKIRK